MSSDGAAPQRFHRFLDLPPELRIEIWKLSLPHRVHAFPTPVKKFHFHEEVWTQEQSHGARATQPPVIAHVCREARAVALSNGSVKEIMIRGKTKKTDRLGHVWVDPKRDTVVVNLSRCMPSTGKLYKSRNSDHLYSLLRSRAVRVAFDHSWVLAMFFEGRGRQFYFDLVEGLKDCDYVLMDLQLDVTDEEATNTGLFGELGANSSVLIPIEDTRQMSRLFDACNNFSTADFLDKWDNFTQYRKPTNIEEFLLRWKKLATREMRGVQRGLDHLTGADLNTEGHDADVIRELSLRAAEIRRGHPNIRPVIMVSRGADGSE